MFSGGRTKKLAGEHLDLYFCKLDSPSPSNISFKSLLVRLQRQNTPLTTQTRGNQKIEASRVFKTAFLKIPPKTDQISLLFSAIELHKVV
jgi:hypothetical protein